MMSIQVSREFGDQQFEGRPNVSLDKMAAVRCGVRSWSSAVFILNPPGRLNDRSQVVRLEKESW